MNRRVPAVLAALLAVSACGPSVEQAALVWQRDHPDSYVFEYQRNCACPGSGLWWRVTVKHDSVVAAQLLDSTAINNALGTSLRMHPTISQLFDGLLKVASRRHTYTRVTYDPKWHYPVSAMGDATDRTNSHFQFNLRNFQPLP